MSRHLITNLIIFSLTVLVFWFGVQPLWSATSGLRQELKTKRETIQAEREIINKLNAVNQVLDSQKTNVERLEQAIPSSYLVPELVVLVDNLASQNGLVLSDIGITPPAEETRARTTKPGVAVPAVSPLKTIKLSFKLSGAYGAFKSWLKAVENNLRILDVNKISFTVAEKKTSSGEVLSVVNPAIDFAVSVDTYIIKK